MSPDAVQTALRDKSRQTLIDSLESMGDYGCEIARLQEQAWVVADAGAYSPSKPTFNDHLREALAEGARRGEERQRRKEAQA